MKRLLLTAAALASLAAPMMASAQDGEVRHDRNQVQRDRHDLHQDQRDAHANGSVNRNEHREINQDRNQLGRAQSNLAGARFDRNNRSWWRGRPEFNGYNGRRAGFWYAPGYGYRAVDARWAGYHWARGGFVPMGYRNYYVRDPYFYGLRPAPYGYRWIYLDNNLALMALTTGAIADIVYNAY